MIFAGEEILLDPFSRRSLQRTYPFSVFHSRAVDTRIPWPTWQSTACP